MINLRPANNNDIDELAKVYADSYNSLDIGENWDLGSAQELMKHFLEAQSDLFFVAEEEGKILGGIVAIVKPWWDGTRITDGEVFVAVSSQGKGIGKELIKRLFEEAKSKYGAVAWDTFTHTFHKHPLEWYKEMGFSEIKHWIMISGGIDKVLENLKQ